MFIWKYPLPEKILFFSPVLVIFFLGAVVYYSRQACLNQYKNVKAINEVIYQGPQQNDYGGAVQANPPNYTQMLASLATSNPAAKSLVESFMAAQSRAMDYDEEKLSNHSGHMGAAFHSAVNEVVQQHNDSQASKKTDHRAKPFKVHMDSDIVKITPMAAYTFPLLVIGTTKNTAYSAVSKVPVVNFGGMWGVSAKMKIYRNLDSDSSTYGTRVNQQAVNMFEFSNTLFLAVDPQVRKKLLSVMPGDQLLINGELVAAEFLDINGALKKSIASSIIREDFGPTSSEVVYVKKADDIIFLNKATRVNYAVFIAACCLLAVYIVLVIIRLYLEDIYRKKCLEEGAVPRFIALRR